MNEWDGLLCSCIEKGLWISTAESCTGGLIASMITDVPGASRCFKGSAVVYSNKSKVELLKVSEDTLDRFGAVSWETASEMASGVKCLFGSDISIAVTGIAGPDGGTDEKPVGTVFIAVCLKGEGTVVEHHLLSGLTRSVFKEEVAVRSRKLLEGSLNSYR